MIGARRPLLPISASYALGIALSQEFSLAIPGSWAVALSATVLAASPPLAPVAFLCAGLAAGSLAMVPPGHPTRGVLQIEGQVSSVPARLGDRARFLLRDLDGRLLSLTAPQPAWPLAWGDRVRLVVDLQPPSGPRNPGGRDGAALARARGVVLEGHARDAPVRVAAPSWPSWIEAARCRFALAAAHSLPPPEAALVQALGTGDASGIDPQTRDAFSRSGLAHVLSVSGLHLAVVAFGIFRLLWWLGNRWDALATRIDARRWAAAAALPAAVLYAVATGADVPVVRSAVAAGAAFLGVLLGREGTALDALALGALGILALDPGALLDPSFQLSFASVLGLCLIAPRLRAAVPVGRGSGLVARAREVVLAGACASAAATLATAPIVAFHFRRFSLLAIPANAVGVPLGSALTVLAALAFLAATISPPAAVPLLWLCGPLARALLAVDSAFAPPWAAPGLASPGRLGLLACYGLGAAALALRGRLRWACALGAAAAFLLPGPIRAQAASGRGLLEVTFLSVGQGDAAILRLPDGSAVLVDAGGDATGRRDPGARDVLPLLLDAGVRRVALAFVSHPHPDHLLGLPAIAAQLPVERLLTSGRVGDEAMRLALDRLPPAEHLRAGDLLERGGVRFEVLGPGAAAAALDDNDASLVLRVRYGDTAFLFPGDLERKGQALLSGEDLAADVVKVPHHGSRTSALPGFAAAVRPRFAVISVAAGNRFGFPHAEALRAWEGTGAAVLRTDDQGAVRFLSDGRHVRRVDAAGAIDALAMWREGRDAAAVGTGVAAPRPAPDRQDAGPAGPAPGTCRGPCPPDGRGDRRAPRGRGVRAGGAARGRRRRWLSPRCPPHRRGAGGGAPPPPRSRRRGGGGPRRRSPRRREAARRGRPKAAPARRDGRVPGTRFRASGRSAARGHPRPGGADPPGGRGRWGTAGGGASPGDRGAGGGPSHPAGTGRDAGSRPRRLGAHRRSARIAPACPDPADRRRLLARGSGEQERGSRERRAPGGGTLPAARRRRDRHRLGPPGAVPSPPRPGTSGARHRGGRPAADPRDPLRRRRTAPGVGPGPGPGGAVTLSAVAGVVPGRAGARRARRDARPGSRSG